MNVDYDDLMDSIDTKMQEAQQKFKQRYAQVFGDGYKDFLSTMPKAEQFGHEVLS